MHHGKIELKSKAGKGTTFSIYFPQSENLYNEKELNNVNLLPVNDSIEEQTGIGDVAHQNTTQPLVLIVEDDEDLLSYLSNNLSGSYNIVTASNGRDALNQIGQNKVDIVLTTSDEIMDGIELVQNIKGRQNLHSHMSHKNGWGIDLDGGGATIMLPTLYNKFLKAK